MSVRATNYNRVGELMQKLWSKNPCHLSLGLNEYKTFYEDAERYFVKDSVCPPDLVGSIDFNLDIWDIRVYPSTPVGFYHGISNDLEMLLAWACDGLSKEDTP